MQCVTTLATARLLVELDANPHAYYYTWGGDGRFTALTGAFGEGEQSPVNQPPHSEWGEFARLLLDAGARRAEVAQIRDVGGLDMVYGIW